MAKKKKEEQEEKSKVTYKDVAPKNDIKVDTNKYMVLLKIFHFIRKNPDMSLTDVRFKFGLHKEVAELVYECVHNLKLEWPLDVYNRIYTE